MTEQSPLLVAYDGLQAADALFERVVKTVLAPGTPLIWERGDRVHRGTVVRECYGTDMIVRNSQTGRELRISAYDVIRAMKGLSAS